MVGHTAIVVEWVEWLTSPGVYLSLISLGFLPRSNRLPLALASCVAALQTTLKHTPAAATPATHIAGPETGEVFWRE